MPLSEGFDRFVSVHVYAAGGPEDGSWRVNDYAAGGPQLLVRADVRKTLSADVNRAVIEVFNLSDRQSGLLSQTRPLTDDYAEPFAFMDEKVSRSRVGAQIVTTGMGHGYVELRAGKHASPPIVFEGSIDMAHTGRPQGHTKITRLDCGDGSSQIKKAHANRSFPWRTPLREIVAYLARTLGLTYSLPSLARAGLADAFTESTVDCSGNPWAILGQISRGFRVGYFVDDGEIVFMNREGYRVDVPTVVRASDVIADPVRRGPDVWRVRMRIPAAPQLGAPVAIVHPELTGTLRADALHYQLQNRGGAFEVAVDLRNLDPLQTLDDTSGAITEDDLVLSSGVV